MGEDHTEEVERQAVDHLTVQEYTVLKGLVDMRCSAYVSASEWLLSENIRKRGYVQVAEISAFGARRVMVWEITPRGREALKQIETTGDRKSVV